MTAAAFTMLRSGPALLDRATSRDHIIAVSPEHAFRRVYDANANALLRYLARSTGNPTLAQDLLQDVFYRYVRSGFVGESDEHRRRYLFKVAGNLLVDFYRRRRVDTVKLEDAPAAATPPRSSLRPDLSRLLNELSPRDRQLLWLAHVEGFSHREIGRQLGLTAGSVRPALFRARKRMATILDRHGIGPEVLKS